MSGESFPSGQIISRCVIVPDDYAIRKSAAFAGISDDVISKALVTLHSGHAVAATFSGKLCSGKDTVAERANDIISANGYTPGRLLASSDAIKVEVGNAISVSAQSNTASEVYNYLREVDMPESPSAHLAELLFENTRDGEFDVTVRTDLTRNLLAYWGVQGRRSTNPLYWVHKSMAAMFKALSEGHSAFISGARFPNEVFNYQVLGITVIRLQVSRSVQEHRLWGRDGLEPKPEALEAEGECALDGYIGFSLEVGNDGDITATLDVTVAEIEAHVARLQS
jgi:hypothetical protein